MKKSNASAESVASFDSRLITLETKYQSVAKRAALDSRRDPETGQSLRVHAPETKADIRRRLGLVGSNAARVAHSIHAQGGLRK
jgi:hypothetical protein